MTIAWNAPVSTGGCSITSYYLYMDDGNGGLFTEVDPTSINNLPSLRSYPITTFVSGDTSSTFKFYMICKNAVGSVTSDTVSFVLAAVPDTPANEPYINLVGTTAH